MVFLDANILLELLLPERVHVKKVADWLDRNEEQACISALTAHLVYHFGSRLGQTKRNLTDFLEAYVIQDLTAADCHMAMGFAIETDYKDAMQLAVAIRSGCKTVVTLDKLFAKRYRGLAHFSLIE